MISRLLLALLFVVTVLCAPVSASCAGDSSGSQMSCCCELADDAGCSIGEDCCDSHSPEPVASARTQLTYQAVSFDTPKIEQAFSTTQLKRGPPVTRNAFHLADNKLYLKKRSLLI